MDELIEHEKAVEHSRVKLREDLAILCSPETRASFTEDLKHEAFDIKDALWEKVKVRAASNPAAVMAIGAGLIWHWLRNPPITSALIGVGLFSLWKTQPRTAYDGTGRRLGYLEQSKEVLKQQAEQAVSVASDVAAKTGEVATTKGYEALQVAKDKMREWQGEIGNTVSEATGQLKTSREDLIAEIRDKERSLRREIRGVAASTVEKVEDPDIRNTLLLGFAGAAIAAAVGIACQKRISESAITYRP
jgi:hypothetical protein